MSRRSPLDAPAAGRLLAYDRRVFDRFVRSSRRFSWRRVSKNMGIGHLSIFRTLVHILNVHDAWLCYIGQGRLRELRRDVGSPSRHPNDWAGFTTYSAQVWAGVEAFAANLNDRRLSLPVKAPWMPGRYTLGDAILQSSIEQAHHFGEIIGTMWRWNIEPPTMTWIEVTRGS